MIAYIEGKVIHIKENSIILFTNNIGYEVFVCNDYNLDEALNLWIYHHIREDSSILFGFDNLTQKDLFEKLISVSGVGPKLGMNIMSGMQSEQLQNAISSKNIALLTSISGVGKKVAERLCLELSGKLDNVDTKDSTDLLSALMSLGFSQNEAKNATIEIEKEYEGESLEFKIKKALQFNKK